MIKRLIIITLFILSLVSVSNADYMNDLVVTGTSGIWTDSRSYSTLNDAVAAIGSADKDLYIAKAESVTTLTIPSNIRLHFLSSGSIANSGQLTLNTKQIFAGDQQIFTGTGDIDFSPGSVVRSSWFSSFVEAINQTNDDYLTLIVSESAFITADCAVGDHVNLRFESPRNRLTANSGFTLSNIKMIEAGNFQLFAGAGDFAFLDGSRLKLDWFARLRSALNWIGTSKVTLVISGSSTIDYNETTPSTLLFDLDSESGLFNISAGVTLTIYSPGKIISSLDRQIVSGTGLLRFTHSGTVSPEWYGAVGDGTTDDYTAFRATYNSLLYSGGGTIQMLQKRYEIGTPIALGLASNLDVPIVFQGMKGSKEEGTILQCSSITSGHALFEQNQEGYLYNHIFRDFAIDGSVSGSEVVGDADAFRLAYINSFHFDQLFISNCNTAFYITGPDVDRTSIKRSKLNANGQDVYFSATAGIYQLHFEDVQFTNTKEGASINSKSGSRLYYIRFENCSWIHSEYEAVKIELWSSIVELSFEMPYSEQNCHTSGDYAFDFLASIPGLSIKDGNINEIYPAEAAVRIAIARSVLIENSTIGNNGVVRAIDFGDGTGDVYGPILLGNTFYADGAGDYITVLGTSTLRNLVSIANIPNDLGQPTVFSVSNYYNEINEGIKFRKRFESRTLTTSDTFTEEDSLTFQLNPTTGNYNFNPSGVFHAGYEVTVTNISAVNTIIFDSTGRNATIDSRQSGIFYYDGSEWRKKYIGDID